LAQEVSSPFDEAVALWATAVLHQWRGNRQQVQEWTEAMVRLSTEQGFAFWLAYGTMLRGWARTEQGQVEEGIAQLEEGLAACRATGTEGGPIRWLPWLAAAYAKAGQAEKGLALLAEASARVNKTGMRFGEAELYRLKGELTLQSKARLNHVSNKPQARQDKMKVPNAQRLTSEGQSEAEACFLKAIEIARHQQAKSWELRATTSLARHWQQQGKKTEAHQLLTKIYSWFTEGFDTKDLQEAKALLEELT
jgi:predicted ATPase